MRADLHIHTNASHGIWSVLDVYDYVRRNDIELFSITEQDFPRTLRVPQDLARRYIPGVELTVRIDDRNVHLLIYGALDARSDLAVTLSGQRRRRVRHIEQMLVRLAEHNIVVTLADVRRQTTVENRTLCTVHVARALVNSRIASTVEEAFDRYLSPGAPAHVPLNGIASSDAVRMAHTAGAVVVAAHPTRLQRPDDLDRLRRDGIDGIEVWHPSADRGAAHRLQQYAARWDLLQTAGSDAGCDSKAVLRQHEFRREWVEAGMRALLMGRHFCDG